LAPLSQPAQPIGTKGYENAAQDIARTQQASDTSES